MANQRIYKVLVQHDVYVAAADELEAERVASRALRDEPTEMFDAFASQLKDVPDRDVLCSLPYGENLGERRDWTVRDWLRAEMDAIDASPLPGGDA